VPFIVVYSDLVITPSLKPRPSPAETGPHWDNISNGFEWLQMTGLDDGMDWIGLIAHRITGQDALSHIQAQRQAIESKHFIR
jgi:hypothetical protein